MKAIHSIPFFILLASLINLCAYSQLSVGKYEIGLQGGVFVYQGDLTPSSVGSVRNSSAGINLYAARLLSPVLSARASLTYARLKGDESKYSNPDYRQQRNFRFTTPVIEFSGLLVWDVLGRNFSNRIKKISPYVFGGAGVNVLNIKRDWSRMNAEIFDPTSKVGQGLNEDLQQTPPRVIPVLPAGAGLRYDISEKFAFNIEGTYRFTFTDYLDGFSRSANPKLRDSYYSVTAGLIYKPGIKNRLNCPAVAGVKW